MPSFSSPLIPAIDRRRAEFADPAVEDRFNRHHLPRRAADLRLALLCCAVFYAAFGVTDIATLGPGPVTWLLLAARFGVAALALAGCAAIAWRRESVRVALAAASVTEIAGMAVFMVLCWFQPEALTWNAMSLALMVTAIYINIPNRLLYAGAIAAASSAVFVAMIEYQGLLRPDDLVAVVLLALLGNVLGYIGARRFSLAQREEFRATLQLQQMADRDPLTGCGNRRVLQGGLLERELTRVSRYGTALAVVLCDIDHFKRINDVHGHGVGDQVLADFASLLRLMTRDTVDTVVRYGGEEFLLVLPETDLHGALALAERIRHAFASAGTVTDAGSRVTVTSSFGVSAVPAMRGGPALPPAALIEAADAQLYSAKRSGRNAVRGAHVIVEQRHLA